MHSSLAEAQAQLRSDGIALDIKTLRSTAYRYAARAAQQSAACGLLDRVTGKRVVVSLDGGRVRVRRKKRGPKTKKGRNRFHTDWKEPKLLILYVVGDDGRPSQTWAPIIDGTLRGPRSPCCCRTRGRSASTPLTRCADGAPFWRRIQRLIAALGLSPTQVPGLIDFYHAAKQLSDAVKLRRWSATQRTRWLNRTRGLLKRARVDEVITALRELCRGRTAGKIRTHLNYFLKPSSFRLHHNGRSRASAGQRRRRKCRVINLRGAPSIGYRRASTRFFSCGLSISPADGTADGHDAGGCERVTGKSGMRLGGLLQSIGRHAEAAQQYRRAVRIDPNHAGAQYNLANILLAESRFGEAEAALRQALAVRPADPDVHASLGHALVGQGRIDAGVAEYREALRLAPDRPQIYRYLGDAFRTQGRLAEAGRALAVARELEARQR